MACIWESNDRRYYCAACGIGCTDRQQPMNFELIEKMASVPAPRQRDEIDEWLEKECNIYAGACSSAESLRYSTAREVAEKLWKKEVINKEK